MNKKELKDGYYLSVYLCVHEIGNLYHIFHNRHDYNVSLWKKSGQDIKLVHYWELERQSRIKHNELPFYSVDMARNAINKLLATYNLTMDDMNEIWGSPTISECRDYENIDSGFTYHGLCHLFSSIMLDSDIFYKENVLGLAVDLRADYETDAYENGPEYVGCIVNSGNIEYFNIESPAQLWAVAKRVFHMEEGTLMALANASNVELLESHVDSIKNELLTSDVGEKMDILEILSQDINKGDEYFLSHIKNYDDRFSIEENKISAVMKEVQKLSKNIMCRQIEKIISKYKIKPEETYLAISGGFGLNCPTNSYLMNKYHFKGFIGCPCINDSGQSLGIALYMFYRNMDRVNFKLKHAFYGDKFDFDSTYLREQGYIEEISELDMDQIVDDLIDGPIVWFDSRAEIGPRALGHRSLLGDSRKIEMKDRLNQVKQRQWWRPVAPIVLQEYVDEWFENAYASPFMLHTFQIREDKRDKVKAIAHDDGSSRIQTVSSENKEEERMHSIISAFYKRTGVPIICNTSLNDKGEPIVNKPEEALHFALKKNIKVAYINGQRVLLKNHSKYKNEAVVDPIIKVKVDDDKKKEYMREINPHGVSRDVLAYAHYAVIDNDYDIKDKQDADKLNRVVQRMFKINGDYSPFDLERKWKNY